MLNLLFSARGRINRARFWLASLLFTGCILLVTGILGGAVVLAFPPAIGANGSVNFPGVANGLLALLYLAYTGVSLWAAICLGVKRYHDLDRAGAWVLIIFVPVVGGLVYFIMAGCFAGTTGPNRFGADPLREYG